MTSPRLEVAEVFRQYKDEYVAAHSASPEQRRVIRDLIACRTAVLGGHLRRCDRCGHEEIAYNSCRNRHCPKCQAQKQAEWLTAQCANLLDVPYYHIVFTLPEELGPLALQNKRLLYSLLFRSAAETLLTIADDPRHLGARIGFTAVLHTWGQTLLHHPHLHCLVPAGGLSPNGEEWISAREHFFLPVRVLSRLFRAKYLAYLAEAYEADDLIFAGRLEDLGAGAPFSAFLETLRRIEWVVYAKPPFGSPEQVLNTSPDTRIGSPSPIAASSRSDGCVAFRYKDYRRGRTDRVMRLAATEFMRRFLLHVLPKRFVRIRHYGLLANRRRRENIELCRRLLSTPRPTPRAEGPPPSDPSSVSETSTSTPHLGCPACKEDQLVFVAKVPPSRAGPNLPVRLLCHV